MQNFWQISVLYKRVRERERNRSKAWKSNTNTKSHTYIHAIRFIHTATQHTAIYTCSIARGWRHTGSKKKKTTTMKKREFTKLTQLMKSIETKKWQILHRARERERGKNDSFFYWNFIAIQSIEMRNANYILFSFALSLFSLYLFVAICVCVFLFCHYYTFNMLGVLQFDQKKLKKLNGI